METIENDVIFGHFSMFGDRTNMHKKVWLHENVGVGINMVLCLKVDTSKVNYYWLLNHSVFS